MHWRSSLLLGIGLAFLYCLRLRRRSFQSLFLPAGTPLALADGGSMHIHILGICGTFMGGIAQIARALGHEVSGSDANVYPPMSTQLEQAGIELMEGYDPSTPRSRRPTWWSSAMP